MVFHYVPTSGSLSSGTSNALGSVMLQTSYRANDAAPTTKIELLNEYWSAENVPFEAFAHPIECNPNENPFNVQYIKSAAAVIPSGDSPLLYDLGTTHVATSGQQSAGVALGDLWVTYEVELKKPIISSNVTPGGFFIWGFYKNPGTPTFANPWGAGVATEGNLPFLTDTNRGIILPKEYYGTWWIICEFLSTAGLTGASLTGTPTVTNCTLENWSPYQDRYETNLSGGNTTNIVTYSVRVFKPNRETPATIQLPIAALGSGTINAAQVSVFGTTYDLP